jgi:hypothetical protein
VRESKGRRESRGEKREWVREIGREEGTQQGVVAAWLGRAKGARVGLEDGPWWAG